MRSLRRNVVWRFDSIYVWCFLSSKWVRSTSAASCETRTKHFRFNENKLVRFVCDFLCLFYSVVENGVTDFETLHNRNSIRIDSIWNRLFIEMFHPIAWKHMMSVRKEQKRKLKINTARLVVSLMILNQYLFSENGLTIRCVMVSNPLIGWKRNFYLYLHSNLLAPDFNLTFRSYSQSMYSWMHAFVFPTNKLDDWRISIFISHKEYWGGIHQAWARKYRRKRSCFIKIPCPTETISYFFFRLFSHCAFNCID